MTDQKYTYRNQAQEILDHIKANPGVSTEGIVSGTGWNRHLVEVVVELMVEQRLVKEIGQTDWLDFKYEAIDRDNPTSSPLAKAASIMSGFAAGFVNPFTTPFSQLIVDSREHERSLIEVAALANITPTELVEFYKSTPYSLEFIKAAIQAGAKLDEEDIKRTMEERVIYHWNRLTDDSAFIDSTLSQAGETIYLDGPFCPPTWADIERAQAMMTQEYTFIVTLPIGKPREVKAAYMEVDGATLYFEDEDHDTILAFGPGHWVWAERKEEDDTP